MLVKSKNRACGVSTSGITIETNTVFMYSNMKEAARNTDSFTKGICHIFTKALCNDLFYYIDTSVLLENIPLIKFIRNYIRDPSGLFSIPHL